jgi:hypothetical protein
MTVFIYEPDAYDEPTLWALERGDTDQYQYTGLLSRCNLAPDVRRFWPDVVARMTGTTIQPDEATVERVAQALWDITIPRWVTMRPAELTGDLREQLNDRARAILAALTGVPHD